MSPLIEIRFTTCRQLFEVGDRRGAYGEMAEILEYYSALNKDLPTPIEELYAALWVADGVDAARTEVEVAA